MTQTASLDPRRIEAPHEITDEAKCEALVVSMTRDGWIGAPIVIVDRDDADPLAITGSHRIVAAREAGIDVPAVDLEDLLAAHGVDLAALVADFTAAGLHTDDAVYEVVVRLDEHLPANTINIYGIDYH